VTDLRDETVTIENARLLFRNFTGKEGKYNRAGDRNFSVLLDDEVAIRLLENGWNVKTLAAREEGEPDQPYITVAIGFKIRPPRIALITHRGRTPLDEDSCEILDWADIKTVDLTLRPYKWEVNDSRGIKAYLQSIFVTIHEDPLDIKYSDLEELPARAGRVDEG